MTAPAGGYGRGAWNTAGHSNGSKYYTYITGKPTDGSESKKSSSHEAINLAIRGIQKCLNLEGYTPALTTDGWLGQKSFDAIKWFQGTAALKVDGVAGPSTCKKLWRQPILAACTTTPDVDPKWIWGQMLHESSADPGACGYYHELDRGLVQINVEAHPEISKAQAHDPYFSLDYTTKRFKVAMNKYAGKGEDLQIQCAILSHNTPAGANYLYANGTTANAAQADYITAVYRQAQTWEE